MSSREQRLLFLLLAALLVFGVLGGYKMVKAKKAAVASEIESYEAILDAADAAAREQASLQEDVEWLASNEPEPTEGELAPSVLETFATNEARRAGLTINRPKILPNDETGVYYHRARFQLNVTGMERELYNWLVRLQSPKDFRALTELRLSPNREDDTKIDATVQVEQWFVPKGAPVEGDEADFEAEADESGTSSSAGDGAGPEVVTPPPSVPPTPTLPPTDTIQPGRPQ